MPQKQSNKPKTPTAAPAMAGPRSSERSQRAQRRLEVTALILCAGALLLWLRLPPFDYDEALYFAMALEMQRDGHWLATLWDGQLMDDKPPVFMWLLLPFLGASESVSWLGFSRLPSLLCTLVMIYGLSSTRWGFQKSFTHTALLFSCGLIPFAGSGLLLIDPVLSLALFPPFLLLFRSWKESSDCSGPRPLTIGESLTIGIFLSLGCSLKGLIAWVIPGLAVLLQCILVAYQGQTAGMSHRFTLFRKLCLRCLLTYGPAALLTVLGSAAFYGWMIAEGHGNFVEAFFVKHHLGRGSAAMEGHSGSFIYHWAVIGVGGSWLIARLLLIFSRPSARKKLLLPQNSFALSWFAAPPLFFSFMATKLPNYTWPSWMALVALLLTVEAAPEKSSANDGTPLSAAEQLHDDSAPVLTRTLQRVTRRVCEMLIGLLAGLYALAGLALAISPFLIPNLPVSIDDRVQTLINSAGALTFAEQIGLFICGGLLCATALSIARLLSATAEDGARSICFVAMLHAALLFTLLSTVAPYPLRAFYQPLRAASEWVANQWPNKSVVTLGLRSPTFSAHYTGNGSLRQLRLHADLSHKQMSSSVIVLPLWSPRQCSDFEKTEAAVFGFVAVCAPTSSRSS